jgi:hypothetical protein
VDCLSADKNAEYCSCSPAPVQALGTADRVTGRPSGPSLLRNVEAAGSRFGIVRPDRSPQLVIFSATENRDGSRVCVTVLSRQPSQCKVAVLNTLPMFVTVVTMIER